MVPNIICMYTHTHRGLSSTVRKCVSRDTGLEYAVKIIDKSQEDAITESIAAEMQVLNTLPPHKHISKSQHTVTTHSDHCIGCMEMCGLGSVAWGTSISTRDTCTNCATVGSSLR